MLCIWSVRLSQESLRRLQNELVGNIIHLVGNSKKKLGDGPHRFPIMRFVKHDKETEIIWDVIIKQSMGNQKPIPRGYF